MFTFSKLCLRLATIFCCSALLTALSSVLPVKATGLAAPDRIEPPFWWTGMQNRQLQLMVHGDQIGLTRPQISGTGLRVRKVQAMPNPNYLIIDLELNRSMRAGKRHIHFVDANGQIKAEADYEFKAREPGSARRRGFGPQDVILNLMPDRFANGNPANDVLPGFTDKLDRSDDSAGRHGGDLAGIQQHLAYIADMGYTMIWPTPVVENNQPQYSYHGYAATDFYRIDARLGSNAEYRELVQQARRHGIGVIQDVVLNHIGDQHWWMRDLPAPDWITYQGKFVPTAHARTTVSDPYAANVDKQNFTQGWFSAHMPDLNNAHPVLAQYQIQNSIWWIEYAGLSGIRTDTYSYSDPGFLAQWSRRILEEYPQFSMVGEEWSTNPNVVARWLRGKVNPDGYVSSMPSMMDFPLQDVLIKALTASESWNGGFNSLYEALVNDQFYPDPARLVLFEGNHDLSRLYTVLNEDWDLTRMALVYLATMPRTPQLYYGTEILMTSAKERNDGAARRDFPGGWSGDTVNAFTGTGLTDAQKNAQSWLKTLLNWRKHQPVIHRGKLMHFAPENGIYSYVRTLGQQQVMVFMNKNSSASQIALNKYAEILPAGARGRELFSGQQVELSQSLSIPARGVLVFELSKP